MVDAVIPVWLAETFVGTVHSYPPRQLGHKGTSHWRITGAKAAKVLEAVYPHLKLKRPQAKLVIDYYADPRSTRTTVGWQQAMPLDEIERRREFVTQSKVMNKRGL